MERKMIYLVKDYGQWDDNDWEFTKAFDTYEKALKEFEDLVKWAKQDSQGEEDIIEESEPNLYECYRDGWYSGYHQTICIEQVELK
jgi:hypothetical protein